MDRSPPNPLNLIKTTSTNNNSSSSRSIRSTASSPGGISTHHHSSTPHSPTLHHKQRSGSHDRGFFSGSHSSEIDGPRISNRARSELVDDFDKRFSPAGAGGSRYMSSSSRGSPSARHSPNALLSESSFQEVSSRAKQHMDRFSSNSRDNNTSARFFSRSNSTTASPGDHATTKPLLRSFSPSSQTSSRSADFFSPPTGPSAGSGIGLGLGGPGRFGGGRDDWRDRPRDTLSDRDRDMRGGGTGGDRNTARLDIRDFRPDRHRDWRSDTDRGDLRDRDREFGFSFPLRDRDSRGDRDLGFHTLSHHLDRDNSNHSPDGRERSSIINGGVYRDRTPRGDYNSNTNKGSHDNDVEGRELWSPSNRETIDIRELVEREREKQKEKAIWIHEPRQKEDDSEVIIDQSSEKGGGGGGGDKGSRKSSEPLSTKDREQLHRETLEQELNRDLMAYRAGALALREKGKDTPPTNEPATTTTTSSSSTNTKLAADNNDDRLSSRASLGPSRPTASDQDKISELGRERERDRERERERDRERDARERERDRERDLRERERERDRDRERERDFDREREPIYGRDRPIRGEAPRDPRDIPRDPRDPPRDPRDIPRDPRDIPRDLRDIPRDPRDIPRDPRDAPRDPRDIRGMDLRDPRDGRGDFRDARDPRDTRDGRDRDMFLLRPTGPGSSHNIRAEYERLDFRPSLQNGRRPRVASAPGYDGSFYSGSDSLRFRDGPGGGGSGGASSGNGGLRSSYPSSPVSLSSSFHHPGSREGGPVDRAVVERLSRLDRHERGAGPGPPSTTTISGRYANGPNNSSVSSRSPRSPPPLRSERTLSPFRGTVSLIPKVDKGDDIVHQNSNNNNNNVNGNNNTSSVPSSGSPSTDNWKKSAAEVNGVYSSRKSPSIDTTTTVVSKIKIEPTAGSFKSIKGEGETLLLPRSEKRRVSVEDQMEDTSPISDETISGKQISLPPQAESSVLASSSKDEKSAVPMEVDEPNREAVDKVPVVTETTGIKEADKSLEDVEMLSPVLKPMVKESDVKNQQSELTDVKAEEVSVDNTNLKGDQLVPAPVVPEEQTQLPQEEVPSHVSILTRIDKIDGEIQQFEEKLRLHRYKREQEAMEKEALRLQQLEAANKVIPPVIETVAEVQMSDVDMEPPINVDIVLESQGKPKAPGMVKAERTVSKASGVEKLDNNLLRTPIIAGLDLSHNTVDDDDPFMKRRKQQQQAKPQLWDKICEENQKVAKENGRVCFGLSIQPTSSTSSLERDGTQPKKKIYRSVEDYPCYHENIRRHARVRKTLVSFMSRKMVALEDKELALKRDYKRRWEEWRKLVEVLDKQREKVSNAPIPPNVRDEDLVEADNVLFTNRNRRGAYNSDAVRSEAEFLEIIRSLENADLKNPEVRASRTTAMVPPMILDPYIREQYRYQDSNHLITDPLTYYRTGPKTDTWSEEEREIFIKRYLNHPKQFGKIAQGIANKTASQCVLFYYREKKKIGLKEMQNGRLRKRKITTTTSASGKRKDKPSGGGDAPGGKKKKTRSLMEDIGEAQANSRKGAAAASEKQSTPDTPNWRESGTGSRRRFRSGAQAQQQQQQDDASSSVANSPAPSSAASTPTPVTTPVVEKRKGRKPPQSRVPAMTPPTTLPDTPIVSVTSTPVEERKNPVESKQFELAVAEAVSATGAATPIVTSGASALSALGISATATPAPTTPMTPPSSGPSGAGVSSGPGPVARWTAAEQTLAMEALRVYGRNFEAVAKAVGTKTVDQCRNFSFNYKRKYRNKNIVDENAASTAVPAAGTVVHSTTEGDEEGDPTEQSTKPGKKVRGGSVTLSGTSSPISTGLVTKEPGTHRRKAGAKQVAPTTTVVEENTIDGTATLGDLAPEATKRPKKQRTMSKGGVLQQGTTINTTGLQSATGPTSATTPSSSLSFRALYSAQQTTPAPSASSQQAGIESGDDSGAHAHQQPSAAHDGSPRRPNFSSYWSRQERQDFGNFLTMYGRDWDRISKAMKTKTMIQVRNYFGNHSHKLAAEGITGDNPTAPALDRQTVGGDSHGGGGENDAGMEGGEDEQERDGGDEDDDVDTVEESGLVRNRRGEFGPYGGSPSQQPSQSQTRGSQPPMLPPSVAGPRPGYFSNVEEGSTAPRSESTPPVNRSVTNIGNLLNADDDDQVPNAAEDWFGANEDSQEMERSPPPPSSYERPQHANEVMMGVDQHYQQQQQHHSQYQRSHQRHESGPILHPQHPSGYGQHSRNNEDEDVETDDDIDRSGRDPYGRQQQQERGGQPPPQYLQHPDDRVMSHYNNNNNNMQQYAPGHSSPSHHHQAYYDQQQPHPSGPVGVLGSPYSNGSSASLGSPHGGSYGRSPVIVHSYPNSNSNQRAHSPSPGPHSGGSYHSRSLSSGGMPLGMPVPSRSLVAPPVGSGGSGYYGQHMTGPPSSTAMYHSHGQQQQPGMSMDRTMPPPHSTLSAVPARYSTGSPHPQGPPHTSSGIPHRASSRSPSVGRGFSPAPYPSHVTSAASLPPQSSASGSEYRRTGSPTILMAGGGSSSSLVTRTPPLGPHGGPMGNPSYEPLTTRSPSSSIPHRVGGGGGRAESPLATYSRRSVSPYPLPSSRGSPGPPHQQQQPLGDPQQRMHVLQQQYSGSGGQRGPGGGGYGSRNGSSEFSTSSPMTGSTLAVFHNAPLPPHHSLGPPQIQVHSDEYHQHQQQQHYQHSQPQQLSHEQYRIQQQQQQQSYHSSHPPQQQQQQQQQDRQYREYRPRN